MTKTLLSGGVIAGAIAGLVAAVFQFFLIQPLIVEAERYETGELVLIGIESNKPDPAPNPLETPGHDAQGAENTDNLLVRNGLTVLTLILTWAGFGLLAGAGLTAFRALPGGGRIPATALGLIGFAVLSLAPAIDLPPELPGMEAAELADRQLWWVATVAVALPLNSAHGALGGSGQNMGVVVGDLACAKVSSLYGGLPWTYGLQSKRPSPTGRSALISLTAFLDHTG